MTTPEEQQSRDEDRALTAFLDRENPVNWEVKYQGPDFLEIAIWVGDHHDFGGMWRVSVPSGDAVKVRDE